MQLNKIVVPLARTLLNDIFIVTEESIDTVQRILAGKIKPILEKGFIQQIQPKIPELIDFIDDLTIKE